MHVLLEQVLACKHCDRPEAMVNVLHSKQNHEWLVEFGDQTNVEVVVGDPA